jgi:hypothetical protein
MIEPSDEDFKQYEIRVSDLANLVGIKSGDIYPAIDRAVDSLMDTPIKFTDGDDRVKVRWLSSSRYQPKKGIALLRFDPELKPFLLQLKEQFTSYQLINIIKLKHKYSIRLYELLKQYEGIGRRRFTLEGLRQILALDDEEYKRYRDFKRWVLLPAQKELKEKTDISFEWNEEKSRRVCTAIEFIIFSQTRPQSANSNDEPIKLIEAQKEKPRNALLNLPVANTSNPTLVDLLVHIGVSQKTAETLVKEHSEERIKSAISYTQAQQKEGKVKNPGGFVVEAIKKEYRDNQAEERRKNEKIQQEARMREERIKKWERLKAAYAEARKAKLEAWRSTLDENDLAGHREKFMETVPPIMKQRKNILEQMFLGYLKNFMSFPSLREWAQQNHLDISEFENEVAQEERQTGV